MKSECIIRENSFVYNIEANRFLRGMVRAITATLLNLGRHKLSMQQFENLFTGQGKAGHSVPPHGLFLVSVNYPENYFPASGGLFRA
jgi:tRNA pseudouridine38-40 synthase